MAQTYTLDQAAGRLGIPVEEFKRRWKTEWTTVRTFRDGGSVRFRSADIDELARTLGMASDPGAELAPPGPTDRSSTSFLLPDDNALDDDIFSISPSDSAKRKGPGKPADSDIRLELDAAAKSARRKATDATPTEELAIDLASPSGGGKKTGPSSFKLTAPKSGPKLAKPSSGSLRKKQETDSSSEFELNLDADSDSFELSLNPDSSDEVELGGSPVVKGRSEQSGINLAKPSDSGVSLEVDSDDSLELSLEPGATTASGRTLTGPKSVKVNREEATGDSDSSEFELALDDPSGLTDVSGEQPVATAADVYETDFELPAAAADEADSDSGSEVVAVENADTDLENSDFDLALDESDIQAEDESASQVVLLDDEPAVAPKSGKGRRTAVDEDEAIDLDDDAASALRGVPRKRRIDEDEEDLDPSKTPAYKAKPWGTLPAAVLIPAFILTFLGGLMSFELLRGMWNYSSGNKPAGSLVRGVADMFDMKPAD